MIKKIDEQNLTALCNELALRDDHLKHILKTYSHPPFWSRTESFETLIHIILEQQVSLASARAALNKLKEKIGEVTAKNLLLLSDEEMRACYFSRQKMKYARCLAEDMVNKRIDLRKFAHEDDAVVRQQLKTVKGIGDWTVDVYLLFALHRTDIFPLGDLAMVNAMKDVMQLPKETKQEELLAIAESWRPLRSLATIMFWHWYICKKGLKV
jgi:DNA-3-methyladenine glycosylase II